MADACTLFDKLRLPVIAAPMFLVSGPDLVLAACRSGIVGAFPAANARTPEQLEAWLTSIEAGLAGQGAGPCAVNINVRPGRYRDFDAIVAVLENKRIPLVITSVGDPSDMVRRVHGWGGLVFHDVTTVHHAQKAIKAGVDGLILICAGAGGHAGASSPFSFLRAVRKFYDGIVVLGGGIADGHGIAAAIALGADLVYMGTRLIISRESMASDAYKRSVIDAAIADIVYTNAISGLPANFIRASIEAAGMNPGQLPPLDAAGKPVLPQGKKAWKDILSAGHAAGLIESAMSVEEIVGSLHDDLRASVKSLIATSSRWML